MFLIGLCLYTNDDKQLIFKTNLVINALDNKNTHISFDHIWHKKAYANESPQFSFFVNNFESFKHEKLRILTLLTQESHVFNYNPHLIKISWKIYNECCLQTYNISMNSKPKSFKETFENTAKAFAVLGFAIGKVVAGLPIKSLAGIPLAQTPSEDTAYDAIFIDLVITLIYK